MAALISLYISAPYFVFALARSFTQMNVRFASGIIRHLVMSKDPAILADYLRNRVFGFDRGKRSNFERLPPFIFEYQPISEALETRIKMLSQKTGGWAGAAFSNVVADADTIEIRSRFNEIFHNPIWHCHYYQELEIIDAIANLIASSAKPLGNPLFSGAASFGKL